MQNEIYEFIRDDPIISPHGHCDPDWFASNRPFTDATSLILQPDHYLLRMLHSQGLDLCEFGIGVPPQEQDKRAIWQHFAAHWHLFLGTPSWGWLTHMLRRTFDISIPFGSENALSIYDQIEAALKTPDFRPRQLLERFNVAFLATTDAATDPLDAHHKLRETGWEGRIVPTFRPDAVCDPNHPNWAQEIKKLARMVDDELGSYNSYLRALRQRRAAFKALGATATDHAQEQVHTIWRNDIDQLYQKVRNNNASAHERSDFYGHMLIEMAQMSIDDGLVMQLHAGSRRNTNHTLYSQFGPDIGADIPVRTDWVGGLEALLNRVGNDPALTVILFTLDETTYARELAPMAGHWPALRIGPPWWFHDSINGIARFFDQVVETAGYWNLVGFNDDTRALCSIPARHDMWRRGVAHHLSRQVEKRIFGKEHAMILARALSSDLARQAYRLGPN